MWRTGAAQACDDSYARFHMVVVVCVGTAHKRLLGAVWCQFCGVRRIVDDDTASFPLRGGLSACRVGVCIRAIGSYVCLPRVGGVDTVDRSTFDNGGLRPGGTMKWLLVIVALFVQEKTSSLLSAPERSEGRMELTIGTPTHMRWEYTSPRTMVWERDIDAGAFQHEQRGDTVILHPVKREVKRLFATFYYVRDKQSGHAREVFFTEKNGDKTHITFTYVTE